MQYDQALKLDLKKLSLEEGLVWGMGSLKSSFLVIIVLMEYMNHTIPAAPSSHLKLSQTLHLELAVAQT